MASPQTENGYTPIANEILEALARTNFSAYESRILWCIVRKTYGWGQKEDWIAISQMVEATGMHRSHVSRAKKMLLARNIVTEGGNKISIQKDYTRWRELPKGVNVHYKLPKGVTKKDVPKGAQTRAEGGISDVPKGAHTKTTLTKETLTKDSGAPSAPTPAQEARLFFASTDLHEKTIQYLITKGAREENVRAEMERFISYWTEPNKSGTKVRWELEKTFDVKRRLLTWFSRTRPNSQRPATTHVSL